MLNRSLRRLLSLAVIVSLGASVAYAQNAADAPEQDRPASLSLDSLMVDPPVAPEPFKIDEALLTPPENATADELFEYIDSLQTKLPQPRSQEELHTIVDEYSKACLQVSDMLLAMDLTPELRERAIQLKVVSLTTRANIDPAAASALDKFVDENVQSAKTTEELVKAYQLKLQVIAASSFASLDDIEALADELLAHDNEELQVFGVEVKAQTFLSTVQNTGEFDPTALKFTEEIIADKDRAVAVKEKALQMKLVALVIASELEKEKDVDEQNDAYAKEAEKLFTTLLTDAYSLELRKMVYQLRVQVLLDPNTTDEQATEKLNALVEKLAKEEDSELYALGVAVKGQMLLNAAKDQDPDAIAAVEKYANAVYEQSKEKEELRTQAIGLKIQSFRLKEAAQELLEFCNAELANDPSEELALNLIRVKISVVTDMIHEDPESFENYAEFIAELEKDEAYAEAVSNMYVARFIGALSKIAEGDADMDAFDAEIERFKKDILACPSCIIGLLMSRQDVDSIGAKNNKDDLFDKTFQDVVNFCKVADNEEVNALAQQLESYQLQMQQMFEQAAQQSAPEASDDASEAEEGDSEN